MCVAARVDALASDRGSARQPATLLGGRATRGDAAFAASAVGEQGRARDPAWTIGVDDRIRDCEARQLPSRDATLNLVREDGSL
jgi:hypothetical protein